MKEELQNKAVEILTSIQTTVSEAKGFTLAQLPDIANQYITYGIVSNVAYSVGALTLTAVCLWITYRLLKNNEEAFMYFICADIVCIAIFMKVLEETIMVIFAPKVWLILELSKLIK